MVVILHCTVLNGGQGRNSSCHTVAIGLSSIGMLGYDCHILQPRPDTHYFMKSDKNVLSLIIHGQELWFRFFNIYLKLEREKKSEL